MVKRLTKSQRDIFYSFTKKQQIFVAERMKGKSQGECYLATGFKGSLVDAGKHGAQLCNKPKIKNFLNEVTEECQLADKAIIERREILQRLTGIMNVNILDILEFSENGDGIVTVNIKKREHLEYIQEMAIKKIEPGEYGLKVTLHDPYDAIKQICKMQGYDAPTKKEVKVHKIDEKLKIQIDEELEAEY